MAQTEAISFCRACTAHCGVRVTIEDGKILGITGDKDHPESRGYVCFKGVHQASAYHGSDRLLHPLKRQKDGSFVRLPIEDALDEIGEKLRQLIDRDGPDAIAMLIGNGTFMNSASLAYVEPFIQALGSRHFYSPATIDQPSKILSFERMGAWAAGPHRMTDADVFMVFGSKAIVSHATLNFVMIDPVKKLKELKARGMKLVVIDPRRTETARFADIFLQPYPGQDAVIAAAMLRIILSEGLEDKAFCERVLRALGRRRSHGEASRGGGDVRVERQARRRHQRDRHVFLCSCQCRPASDGLHQRGLRPDEAGGGAHAARSADAGGSGPRRGHSRPAHLAAFPGQPHPWRRQADRERGADARAARRNPDAGRWAGARAS